MIAPKGHCCGQAASTVRRPASSITSCSPRCEASAEQLVQQRMCRRSSAARQSVVASAARPRHTAAYAAAGTAPPILSGLMRHALGGEWALAADDSQPLEFACVGLAQSIVDITTEESVDDALLPALRVEKGGRRVLESVDERHEVLSTLDDAGCVTKITPGGSLANTLVGIARLSAAAAASRRRHRPLRVALGTSCGSDPIGQYFTSQLNSAGVTVLPSALQSSPTPGHTGTVFVLPSADAQRSFLSFFHSEALGLSPDLLRTAANSRLLIIEGYLWEMPGAAEAVKRAVAAARAGGARVALTAGDPGVVARHRSSILKVLESAGEDVMFFSNTEEACELVGRGRSCCPKAAAKELSRLCAVAVVTDGGNGSHIAAGGRVTSVPPAAPPGGVVVDTCGAGDAYAAGFIFALASGVTCARSAGAFAGRVAARVISRHGAQLHEDEARALAALLPQATPRPSASSAPLASGELPTLLRPAASPFLGAQWQP